MIESIVALMTETEVAAVLRRTKATVKRLRLTGRLRFIPGRPVMVDKRDLDAFIEAEKVRGDALATKPEEKTVATIAKPKSFAEMTERERVSSARQWVLRQKRKPPRVRGPATRPPPPGG